MDNNPWFHLSTKQSLWILLFSVTFVVIIKLFSGFIASNISSLLLFIAIAAFFSILGGAYLIKGVGGLLSKKTYGNASKFSTKYAMDREKISTRYKEYKGIQRITLSIISILLGVILISVALMIFYPIFFSP